MSMLRNLLGQQKKSRLPSGYTQVKSVKIANGAYINTGIIHKSAPTFDLEWCVLSDGDIAYFGNLSKYEGMVSFNVGFSSTMMAYWYLRYGDIYTRILIYNDNVTNDVWTLFYHNFAHLIMNRDFYINGMYVGKLNDNGSVNFEQNTQHLLIGVGHYGVTSAVSAWRSAKIILEDEIVCDLIPCYRNADNVVGMYDVVSGVFKTNEGGRGTITIYEE